MHEASTSLSRTGAVGRTSSGHGQLPLGSRLKPAAVTAASRSHEAPRTRQICWRSGAGCSRPPGKPRGGTLGERMERRATDQSTTALPRAGAPDTEVVPRAAVTVELPVRGAPTAVEDPRSLQGVEVPRGEGPARALRLAVVTLLVLLVLSLGALVALAAQPTWFASLRSSSGAPSNPAGSRHGGQRPRAPHGTALAPAQGTSAAISSIQPSSGSAGSTVAIVGRGMRSPNGAIVAHFGTEVAPTRCPSEERCLVTVPPAPHGSPMVPVRLQIGSGMSNALMFRYR